MADTTVQSSERVRSQALNDAEELGSPVVTVVTKRIRAAKKRLSKIERIEAKAQDQPDKIDKDQKETLSSKPKTVANIEELERLIPLLEEAKADEITAAVNKAVEKALAEERANVAAQAPPTPAAPANVSDDVRSKIESKTVERLLHLLYFSQTFDFQKPGEMTKLERNACLSYYNHHYQDREMPLTPDDLLLMCRLGNLLVSRPTTECISHAEALQEAHNLAVQWLHPTGSPIASLGNNTMDQVSRCLERVMATDYITVRPVLAESEPEAQEEPVHVPGNENGYHSQPTSNHASHSEQASSQERPNTPELHQQESHIFSDVTHATHTSPSQSPPEQESGQTHFTPADPQGHSYPQSDPEHDFYSHPQSQPTQEGAVFQSYDGQQGQHASYVAPNQANGQAQHASSAPPLVFMANGSMDQGGLESFQLQEPGSDPYAHPSKQQPHQTDMPDSAYTARNLPSEATNGTSHDSEGRAVPPEAPLQGRQGSYGTRQRGEGSRGSDRQGSYNRGHGGGGYQGSAPRGRGPPRSGRDQGGRGGGGRRGGRSEGFRGRGGYSSERGDGRGKGSQGNYQHGYQERPEAQYGY